MFSVNTISIQESEHSMTNSDEERPPVVGHQPIGGRKEITAVPKIREALKFIRNQQFEVNIFKQNCLNGCKIQVYF